MLLRDRGVISSGSALASGYLRYSDESSKIVINAGSDLKTYIYYFLSWVNLGLIPTSIHDL